MDFKEMHLLKQDTHSKRKNTPLHKNVEFNWYILTV